MLELHQRDDAAEIRDEAAEHAGLVHQSQNDLRRVARGQQVEKQAVGLAVGAQRGVDAFQRLRDEARRAGMDREAVPIGKPEETDEVHGIAPERVGRGERQAIIVDRESLGQGGAGVRADRAHEAVEHGARLRLALLESRANDRGEISDVLGDQEIIFHETLDAGETAAGREAESLGQRALVVEAQALLGMAGHEMHVAAHPATRSPRSGRTAETPRAREQAGVDEVGALPDAIDVFGDPEERVEIAQTALALLDVRLDDVARAPGAGEPSVPLRELRRDEFRRRVLDDLGVEPLHQRLEQRAVAEDESRFEDRGADRHVGARLLQALAEGARRVPDLLAQIPEDIEDALHDLLRPCAIALGQEEQEVDVRAGGERAPAVAADGHHCRRRPDAAAGRARMHVTDDVVENGAEELVLDERELPCAGEAAAIGVERIGGERLPRGERATKQRDHGTWRRVRPLERLCGGDRRRDLRPVEEARGRDRQTPAARGDLRTRRRREAAHKGPRGRLSGMRRAGAPRHPRTPSRDRGRRRA